LLECEVRELYQGTKIGRQCVWAFHFDLGLIADFPGGGLFATVGKRSKQKSL